MNVLYFAVHDRSYPRNSSVRDALTAAGHKVQVVEIGQGSVVRKWVALLFRGLRAPGKFDLIIVSEFTQHFATAGWVIARIRRAQLALDFFVGLYETRVEDHGSTRARSIKGHALWLLDWLALRLADFRFTDTAPRARTIERRFRTRDVLPVAVGAPEWATMQPWTPSERLRLLYYGNYIPLHGLPLVVQALGELSYPERFAVTFVGGTEAQRADMKEQLDRLSPKLQVDVLPPCREDELAALIANCDVVIGVFGTSRKAAEVVANKVWQGLLCGRIVVTRASVALEGISEVVGDCLVQVDPGEARNLAAAFNALQEAAAERTPAHAAENRAKMLREVVTSEMRNLTRSLEFLVKRGGK